MSNPTLHPDNPRLTAYVLGELNDAERAEIEQLMAECPETRTLVEEIRGTVTLLADALAGEPAPALTTTQRRTIEQAATGPAASSVRPQVVRTTPRRKGLFVVASAVAVVAAALVLLVNPPVADQLSQMAQHSPDEKSQVTSSSTGDSLRSVVMSPDGTGIVGKPVAQPQQEHSALGLTTPRSGTTKAVANASVALGTEREAVISPGAVANQKQTRIPDAPVAFLNRQQWSRLIKRRARYDAMLEGARRRSRQPQSASRPERRKPGNGVLARNNVRLYVHKDGWRNAKTPDRFGRKPSGEQYEPIIENEFLSPLTAPLSTFSVDVDTASYSNVRRFLMNKQWPPADAVRIEELVNYFHYDYPQPKSGRPFTVNLEIGPCPWQTDHRLVRVGLKGRVIDRSKRPPSNLVFLLDVSGSMRDANKLPLVKTAMEMLVGQMTEDDRIAIVTYAGKAGVLLKSTSGHDKKRIFAAIRSLRAGGSTNGEAGITLAYQQAVSHYIDKGANRVILCTDGDFNVGTSKGDALVQLIRQKAKGKVFLSIFGFGMGNLKDAKLEKLADNGNGHYAYIDSINEAGKVFVEELSGTLYTIAKDVKIQIEFNPQQVGAYRLIGYENRRLASRDFKDDTKDAGDIGAGHTVTALYEIIPLDKLPRPAAVEPLKYQKKQTPRAAKRAPVVSDADRPVSRELLTLKLRYKLPNAQKSVKLEFPLADRDKSARNTMPSRDFEWAAAVAGFGMILRNSRHRGLADFYLVKELATGSKGRDPAGRRREFLELIERARTLQTPKAAPAATER